MTTVVYDFNEAVAEALDGRELPEFVAKSLYHRCLEPYLQAFGSERILVHTLESASADPRVFLGRVFRFLNVGDFRPSVGGSRVNRESHSSRSPFRRRVNVIPPTPETTERLRTLFDPETRRLEAATGTRLTLEWGASPPPPVLGR